MDTDEEKMITCVCKKEFLQKSILKHLARKKDCKEAFGKNEYTVLVEARDKRRQQYNKDYNKDYHEEHGHELRQRMKISYAENSSPVKKKRRQEYANNSTPIKDKRRQEYVRNPTHFTDKKKQEYAKNPMPIRNKRKVHYSQNHEEIKKKRQEDRQKETDDLTKAARIIKFRRKIIEGPNFICFNCNRSQFRSGVVVLKVKDIQKPDAEIQLDESFLKKVGLFDLDKDLELIFCHKCLTTIREAKVPDISTINGLQLDHIPDDLKLTDLEQQLIARTLLFLKIKKLPKTRMKSNFAKIVIVPLESEDVQNTVAQLPRHPDDAQIIAVQLKKKLEYKNSHLSQYIRPNIRDST